MIATNINALRQAMARPRKACIWGLLKQRTHEPRQWDSWTVGFVGLVN